MKPYPIVRLRIGAARTRACASVLAAFLGLLALTACALPDPATRKKEAERVAPRLEEPRSMAVGDTKTFQFAADGIWYPAPIMINRGNRVKITFSENCAPLPNGVVRYRIGQKEQILISDPTDFVVTFPGPMQFLFDIGRGIGFRGNVEVTVTRVG